MATWNLLGTGTFNTNSGTKATSGAAPTIGDLIVVVTAHTGNTSAATPTDDNPDGLGAYTRVATAVKVASADTMGIHIRNQLCQSGASTIVTHAPGTSTGGGLLALRLTGVSRVGANASRQTGKQDNVASGTPAPAFGVAATGTNPLIGAIFNGANPAGMTQPATFDAERVDGGYATPTSGLEIVSDDTGNTDTTVTWGSSSGTAFCSLIVEIDATGISLAFVRKDFIWIPES